LFGFGAATEEQWTEGGKEGSGISHGKEAYTYAFLTSRKKMRKIKIISWKKTRYPNSKADAKSSPRSWGGSHC
jgi:hypothetical protein